PSQAGDGFVDEGEQGLSRMTLRLRNSAGNIIQTTTTNYHGYYQFEPIAANQTYTIESVQPSSYNRTWTNKGGVVMPDGGAIAGDRIAEGAGSFVLLNLTYNEANTNFNFGLNRQVGDLNIRVWNVDTDTLFAEQDKLIVQTSSPAGYFDRTEGANDFDLSGIPTDTYTSVQVGNLGNMWTDVTRTHEGCNASAQVRMNETAEINLCYTGIANVRIDKAVYDQENTQWTSEGYEATPGEDIAYSVVIWNNGTRSVDLDINDILTVNAGFPASELLLPPVGANFPLSVTLPGSTDCQKPEFGFAAGQNGCQLVIRYTRKAAESFDRNGSYLLTDTASFSGDAQGSASASVQLTYQSDLAYGKQVFFADSGVIPSSSNPARPGDSLRYVLTLANTGNAPSPNAQYSDNIADLLRYAEVTSVVDGSRIYNNVVWTNVSVPAGESVELVFFATIKPSIQWQIAGDNNPYVIDNNFHGNPTQVPVFDLVINKSVVTSPIAPHDMSENDANVASWTVTVTNRSAINAADLGTIWVKDAVPVGFEGIGLWYQGNLIIPQPCSAEESCTIKWSIAGLEAQQSASFLLKTRNTEHYSGSHRNIASVFVDEIYFNQSSANVVVRAPKVVLDGYVWIDSNIDGLINSGEQGLAGVTVRLQNGEGVNLQSRSTDSNGYYQFAPVDTGADYRIVQIQPANYDSTHKNTGGQVNAVPARLGAIYPTGEEGLNTFVLNQLTYTQAQTTYNFAESRQTGNLQIRIWNVDDNRELFTPVSMLHVLTVGPEGYENRTENSNQYLLESVPTGRYRASLISQLNGWTDVSDSFAGCNSRVDVVTTHSLDNPAAINLCLTGDAELKISKAVFDPEYDEWIKDYQAASGEVVKYAVAIWNTGNKDIDLTISDVLGA
ncbi:MAG TPA: DUF11 domain-containing protein, partial [Candidatus Wirthbacteria bacterium]|nr:DUF11 domain-containing protein [Candidatus Wirthbacteria bacterium]